jgi:hypothetical protein
MEQHDVSIRPLSIHRNPKATNKIQPRFVGPGVRTWPCITQAEDSAKRPEPEGIAEGRGIQSQVGQGHVLTQEASGTPASQGWLLVFRVGAGRGRFHGLSIVPSCLHAHGSSLVCLVQVRSSLVSKHSSTRGVRSTASCVRRSSRTHGTEGSPAKLGQHAIGLGGVLRAAKCGWKCSTYGG